MAAPLAREIGPGPARASSFLGGSAGERSPGTERSRLSAFHCRGKLVALACLFMRGGLVLIVVDGAEELPLKLAVVNPAARLGISIRSRVLSLVRKLAKAKVPSCLSRSYSGDSFRSTRLALFGTEKLAPGDDLVDEDSGIRL